MIQLLLALGVSAAVELQLEVADGCGGDGHGAGGAAIFGWVIRGVAMAGINH